ncbi:MAG: cohesin domain-containing protein [Lachnospiraceae bacterium]
MSRLKKAGKLSVCAALCMICMLLVPIFRIPAHAAEAANITAVTTTAEKNETVKVVISLNSNPGIWGLRFKVDYDHNALTLKSADAGTVFTSGEITAPPTLNEKEYIFVADRSDFTDTTATGALVTLTFQVKGDAKAQSYPIGIKLEDSIAVAGNEVSLTTGNGSVTVQEKPSKPDDEDSGKPSKPDGGDSGKPSKPDGGDSGKPSKPDGGNSENPSKPGGDSNTNGGTNQNNAVKPENAAHPNTGDNTLAFPFVLMGIGSLAAIAVVTEVKKAKGKK